jgi:predicted membrane-bound spermidine synthase
MQLQQHNRGVGPIRAFSPALIWAIIGGPLGGGMSAALSILYTWFARQGITVAMLQSNAALGALVGAHLGLLVAYLHSCADEAAPSAATPRRDWFGVLMAALLLIYAICWIAISL